MLSIENFDRVTMELRGNRRETLVYRGRNKYTIYQEKDRYCVVAERYSQQPSGELAQVFCHTLAECVDKVCEMEKRLSEEGLLSDLLCELADRLEERAFDFDDEGSKRFSAMASQLQVEFIKYTKGMMEEQNG